MDEDWNDIRDLICTSSVPYDMCNNLVRDVRGIVWDSLISNDISLRMLKEDMRDD